jgi:cytochrome c553
MMHENRFTEGEPRGIKMRTLVWILAFSCISPVSFAADKPDWAFPVTEKIQPQVPPDDGKPKTAPGSSKTYTKAEIEDLFNPPDWYPDTHPPMPRVVSNGNAPQVRACAACHLPIGTGHDESANVAGLPVAYFLQQMADYKSGARKGSGSMATIAKSISDEEARAAAEYFASIKPRPWINVVETADVAKTYVGPGNKRLVHPDRTMEPIGQRIIEIPENETRVLNRDPGSGFVAFVPLGAIAKGQALVAGGGSKTVACASCHGADLKGTAEIPGLAGRTATYIVRQLFMTQSGERDGVGAQPMKAVVAQLETEDMLYIAAYLASMTP